MQAVGTAFDSHTIINLQIDFSSLLLLATDEQREHDRELPVCVFQLQLQEETGRFSSAPSPIDKSMQTFTHFSSLPLND